MPELIERPTRIPVPGDKIVNEYVGRVNTGTEHASVAHMVSPSGWTEPPQTPDFDEVTVVLRGSVRLEHEGGTVDVRGGQAVLTKAGERVRYSTPEPEGAEYISVCVPAFTPESAHRDPED